MAIEFSAERSQSEQEQALRALKNEVRIMANCMRATADRMEAIMESCLANSKEYRKD